MIVPAWRRHAGAALAIAALAIASCSSPTGPFGSSISGHVRVLAILSDPTGAPTGLRAIDDATGVRVYLIGTKGIDSTVTHGGAYAFDPVGSGTWQVAVGVPGVMTDTVQVSVNPITASVADTLVLGRTGTITSTPNPFAFSTVLLFGVPATTPGRLQVTTLGGALRRVVLEQNFVAGLHAVTWDGKDDAGQTVADGPYAVEFLAGADRRCEIVIKEP